MRLEEVGTAALGIQAVGGSSEGTEGLGGEGEVRGWEGQAASKDQEVPMRLGTPPAHQGQHGAMGHRPILAAPSGVM